MQYRIGTSQIIDAEKALEEALLRISTQKPLFVFFFSDIGRFAKLGKLLCARFPDTQVAGATMHSVFQGAMEQPGQLLIFTVLSGVECQANVLEEIARYPAKYANRIEDCANRLSSNENCVCFEFTCALFSCEELVLDTLNAVLEKRDIPVFGASTGSNQATSGGYVFLNGQVYDQACLFVLVKNLSGRIGLYRENIYTPTDHRFLATDVNVPERRVGLLDGVPTAEMMSRMLGITQEQLAKEMFMHPLGRLRYGKIYITEASKIFPDGSVSFYARIYNNTKLVLLKQADYRSIVRNTLSQIAVNHPAPSLAFIVHCTSRTSLFLQDGFFSEFTAELDKAFPCGYVGVSGFGEQLRHMHLNQTMLIAVFD